MNFCRLRIGFVCSDCRVEKPEDRRVMEYPLPENGGAGFSLVSDDIDLKNFVQIQGGFLHAVLREFFDSGSGVVVAIFDCDGYIFAGLHFVEQAGD